MRKAKKEALANYEKAHREWAFDQTTVNFDKMKEAEKEAFRQKITYSELLKIGRKIHEELEKSIFEKYGVYYIPA